MKNSLREKKRRENLSKETLEKMSKSAQGRTGMKNPFFGKHHDQETKEKLSKLRWRAVQMFDLNGLFIKEFKSIKNASEEMGINKVAISNCCRGITKTSGGYIWKYSENAKTN